ncbi:hypothetical protein C8R47DRAFT_1066664 [Mycena vitilis]|nr:hypothetical protein C8R47DRAFT_1066664 [Mycena vitilis]
MSQCERESMGEETMWQSVRTRHRVSQSPPQNWPRKYSACTSGVTVCGGQLDRQFRPYVRTMISILESECGEGRLVAQTTSVKRIIEGVRRVFGSSNCAQRAKDLAGLRTTLVEHVSVGSLRQRQDASVAKRELDCDVLVDDIPDLEGVNECAVEMFGDGDMRAMKTIMAAGTVLQRGAERVEELQWLRVGRHPAAMRPMRVDQFATDEEEEISPSLGPGAVPVHWLSRLGEQNRIRTAYISSDTLVEYHCGTAALFIRVPAAGEVSVGMRQVWQYPDFDSLALAVKLNQCTLFNVGLEQLTAGSRLLVTGTERSKTAPLTALRSDRLRLQAAAPLVSAKVWLHTCGVETILIQTNSSRFLDSKSSAGSTVDGSDRGAVGREEELTWLCIGLHLFTHFLSRTTSLAPIRPVKFQTEQQTGLQQSLNLGAGTGGTVDLDPAGLKRAPAVGGSHRQQVG